VVFSVVVVVVAFPVGAGAEIVVCWVVVLLPREPKFPPEYKKAPRPTTTTKPPTTKYRPPLPLRELSDI
jgi:hypothetical protein